MYDEPEIKLKNVGTKRTSIIKRIQKREDSVTIPKFMFSPDNCFK